MKFKNQEEKEDKKLISKELYSAFSDILQIEEDKLSLIEAGKICSFMHGNMNYKKFLIYLFEGCIKNKYCLLGHLYMNEMSSPEITIHSVDLKTFETDEKFFELLASAEDEYVAALNKAVSIAYNDQNWGTFHYLLKKLESIDHLCCRAYEAVKGGYDLLALIPCEQHFSEK